MNQSTRWIYALCSFHIVELSRQAETYAHTILTCKALHSLQKSCQKLSLYMFKNSLRTISWTDFFLCQFQIWKVKVELSWVDVGESWFGSFYLFICQYFWNLKDPRILRFLNQRYILVSAYPAGRQSSATPCRIPNCDQDWNPPITVSRGRSSRFYVQNLIDSLDTSGFS